MEAVCIAIICLTIFGVIAGVSAFIRQLLLSRDKKLNDLAQQKALEQEVQELERLRSEMSSDKRFVSHYQVLGSNKEAIQYLDQKIEMTFKRKAELIHKYAQNTLEGSSAIINGSNPDKSKAVCDKLKEEIDCQIKFYDEELAIFQKRRAALWDSHAGLQDYLLKQEKHRNKHLDNVYQQHTGLLEKIYLKHNENRENIAKITIEAATETFKALFKAPLDLLLGIFKLSSNISKDAPATETLARKAVFNAEKAINFSAQHKSNNFIEALAEEKQPVTMAMAQ